MIPADLVSNLLALIKTLLMRPTAHHKMRTQWWGNMIGWCWFFNLGKNISTIVGIVPYWLFDRIEQNQLGVSTNDMLIVLDITWFATSVKFHWIKAWCKIMQDVHCKSRGLKFSKSKIFQNLSRQFFSTCSLFLHKLQRILFPSHLKTIFLFRRSDLMKALCGCRP